MYREDMIVLDVVYLICYNIFALLGWSYIWYLQVNFYVSGEDDFWALIQRPLKIIQTSALLEIVHVVLHLTHSSVIATAVQVLARLYVLWGYANISIQSQQAPSIRLLVHAWSIVEVPRYLFYLVKLIDIPMPTWLLFLRYNLFYVLYPAGMLGEILTIVHALPFIKQSHIFSIYLPNKWNFVFNYYAVSICVLLLYIPCWFIYFDFMF